MAVDPDVIPVIDDKVKAAIDAARVEWQKDIADAVGVPPVDPPVDPPPDPAWPPLTTVGPHTGRTSVVEQAKRFVGRQALGHVIECSDLCDLTYCEVDATDGGIAIYSHRFRGVDVRIMGIGRSRQQNANQQGHGVYARDLYMRRVETTPWSGYVPNKDAMPIQQYGNVQAKADVEDVLCRGDVRCLLHGTDGGSAPSTWTDLHVPDGRVQFGYKAASNPVTPRHEGTIVVRGLRCKVLELGPVYFASLVFIDSECGSVTSTASGSIDTRGLTVG